MKTLYGTLAAPFSYFGGKSGACKTAWDSFGRIDNYVEPFAGSAAMLLGSPYICDTETINDKDGFIANFWRSISKAPDEVAHHADWPVNETDLFARHSWLVRQREELTAMLEADPGYYDAKIAGWWCWGACAWIGTGWCSGEGPWVHDGERIVDSRQLPHLGNAGKGINRQLPHLGDVRVTSGDWKRVLGESVTTRHGVTGIFLDPPYTKGAMDYGAGGMGLVIADDVRDWCRENGGNDKLRIVLCGHAGEHDELLQHGWTTRTWVARGGYAITAEAVKNYETETLWCSPACVEEKQQSLF